MYCNTGNVTKCGPRKAQILNGLPDGGGDSGDPMRAQNELRLQLGANQRYDFKDNFLLLLVTLSSDFRCTVSGVCP